MQTLIDEFKLKPHPEGGYYGEVFRSNTLLNSPVHGQARPTLTHIYFLLLKGQHSRFHRVLHDEVWNFYSGDPLVLREISTSENVSDAELKNARSIIIGDRSAYAHVIPAGYWQAAETTGEYSFVGCSVAPGFDFADFSFMESSIHINWLRTHRPEWAHLL